jgi:hypothetical protein
MELKPPPCLGTGMPDWERSRICEVPSLDRYFFDTVQRGPDDAISSSHIVRICMS